MLGHSRVRCRVVWWVERMVIGIRVVATNVSVSQTSGLWSHWFLRVLKNSLRFLFGRQRRWERWEVNGSFWVKVAKGIAGTARVFWNHHPGGSCGRGRWINTRM